MNRSLLLSALTALIAAPLPVLHAQTGDALPVDSAQMLQALKQLRDTNETGIKNRRTQAYQQIVAAMSSPEKAVAFWKEAVKGAQFQGADNETNQVRNWRDSEGDALNDKLCQAAVTLHLRWLALTLQHSAGYETKQLLPQVLEFIKAVQAQDAAANHFSDQLNKARERANENRRPGAAQGIGEDALVKRVHDQILRTSVTQSPVAKWLQLGELVSEASGSETIAGFGGRRGGNGGNGGNVGNNTPAATASGPNAKPKAASTGSGGWEAVPANLDGIYSNIVLPEFRAAKDPRLLEYWDMYLKRETDRAAERKLDVDQRDWVQIKRPVILWNRAQDVLLLGFRNRAINDMFTIVKTFPQHPEAPTWIGHIESLLASPAPTAPAPSVAPVPASAPTAPSAGVPTATLIPPTAGTTPVTRP